jgi:hypothetical protein
LRTNKNYIENLALYKYNFLFSFGKDFYFRQSVHIPWPQLMVL